MTAIVRTVAYLGLEARGVEVQVQLIAGLPAFNVVGLGDKAVAESRESVRGALAAIGLALGIYPIGGVGVLVGLAMYLPFNILNCCWCWFLRTYSFCTFSNIQWGISLHTLSEEAVLEFTTFSLTTICISPI